jgi:hypothetical protein
VRRRERPLPHGARRGPQPVRRAVGDRLFEGVGQVVVAVGDQLGQQGVPVGEVPVQGRARDTHALADRVHRDARDAVRRELLHGDALDLLAGLLPVLLPSVHVVSIRLTTEL